MSSAPSSDPAHLPVPPLSDSGVDDDGEVIRFDCFEARDCIEKLLAHCHRVVKNCSRIEMRLEDGNMVVLISKCELDSLEEALEMLSRTGDGTALHNRVRGLAQVMQSDVLTPSTPASDGEAN